MAAFGVNGKTLLGVFILLIALAVLGFGTGVISKIPFLGAIILKIAAFLRGLMPF